MQKRSKNIKVTASYDELKNNDAVTVIPYSLEYRLSSTLGTGNDYIDITSRVIDNKEVDIKTETSTSSKKQLEYTAVLEIPKIGLKRGVVNSTKNFNSINNCNNYNYKSNT